MNIDVLKFGGSSVATNKNLQIVANKIIEIKKKTKNIVVIVSAQGDKTNNLIKQAKELSSNPNKREMDALLQVGEQITASKLAILLNEIGYPSISLNGWQAGILTNNDFQNARIERINSSRIIKELKENKIVIITGFQGVDINNNITTLGRGGSDTSAVAIASSLKIKKCYIFSDVDGIYTTDPKKVEDAKKINSISYKEMQILSNEGAKVLHDRSVGLAEKNNIKLICESTFNNNKGTCITNLSNITNDIEKYSIKSIIKNDNILLIRIRINNTNEAYNILEAVVNSYVKINYIKINANEVIFSILKQDKKEVVKSLFNNGFNSNIIISRVSKVSIIGSGISNNYSVIKKVINHLNNIVNDTEAFKEEVLFIDISSYKISIIFKKIVDNKYINNLHKLIFNHIIEKDEYNL